nr:MAG TPA: hypothetical protein [Bacteriophage sp.]
MFAAAIFALLILLFSLDLPPSHPNNPEPNPITPPATAPKTPPNLAPVAAPDIVLLAVFNRPLLSYSFNSWLPSTAFCS